MGTQGERKLGSPLRGLVENSRYVLAMELLSAAQALDLRDRPVLGVGTRAAYQAVRRVVLPFMAEDQYRAPAIEAVYQLLASGRLLAALADLPAGVQA